MHGALTEGKEALVGVGVGVDEMKTGSSEAVRVEVQSVSRVHCFFDGLSRRVVSCLMRELVLLAFFGVGAVIGVIGQFLVGTWWKKKKAHDHIPKSTMVGPVFFSPDMERVAGLKSLAPEIALRGAVRSTGAYPVPANSFLCPTECCMFIHQGIDFD